MKNLILFTLTLIGLLVHANAAEILEQRRFPGFLELTPQTGNAKKQPATCLIELSQSNNYYALGLKTESSLHETLMSKKKLNAVDHFFYLTFRNGDQNLPLESYQYANNGYVENEAYSVEELADHPGYFIRYSVIIDAETKFPESASLAIRKGTTGQDFWNMTEVADLRCENLMF